ncbi:MAG: hypothetical protein KJ709_01445 [Nanoarchaeota archaeon]|nr:hypothetical protein [Nanoarchaeota archaeon]
MRVLLLGVVLLVIVGAVEAQEYVYGWVFDAKDGQPADGYNITLWYTGEARSNNATDEIGPNGLSGSSNQYVIDCEALTPSCSIDDNLTLAVIDQGDSYIAGPVHVLVTGDGIDYPDDMTLTYDHPPPINITSPRNGTSVNMTVLINATVSNVTYHYVDDVFYSIDNGTDNMTKTGVVGKSILYKNSDTDFYNDTWDTSGFENGNYLLWVWANNTVGAWNYTFSNITIDNLAELHIVNITFSNYTPREGINLTINATIVNSGTKNATNVTVSFFIGNYTIGGNNIGANISVNVTAGENATAQATWITYIGSHNIFVVVDPPTSGSGSIDEMDESNNEANETITILGWTFIVGNLSGSLVLGDELNNTLLTWTVTNFSKSLVFVTDSESVIDFTSLSALGRNTSNASLFDDFAELDKMLNMTNLTDSINRTFTLASEPITTMNFTIFSNKVHWVPVINSTNSTDYQTGILWDTTDDTDGTFNSTDSEDILFFTQANPGGWGYFGRYDYEITVPSYLRNFDTNDKQLLVLYAELK